MCVGDVNEGVVSNGTVVVVLRMCAATTGGCLHLGWTADTGA
jgi:hypothetical protein